MKSKNYDNLYDEEFLARMREDQRERARLSFRIPEGRAVWYAADPPELSMEQQDYLEAQFEKLGIREEKKRAEAI